jgi:two-component system osmolarity sensor histidine kinase EnvZ
MHLPWGIPDPFSLIKNRLPKGLYQRSLIIIIAPVVLLQAALTHTFYERHWQNVTELLSNNVSAEIAYLIDTGQYKHIEGSALATAAVARFGFVVNFEEGGALPSPGGADSLLEETIRKKFADNIKYPFWFDVIRREDKVDIRVVVGGGVLDVKVRASRVYATNWHIFLVWMIVTSTILLAIAVLFLRNQVRPILRLSYAAQAFGKGRDVPFKPSGALEVRMAAESFIAMRDRIKRHIEQRTEMLAGVSHDLRTPLTRMKLSLAFLPDDPEIRELRADIREMERMLEEYLDFARGAGGEDPQLTDLAGLAAEVCEGARREGADVTLKTEGELSLRARRNALKRCLTNIVGNAARYGRHVIVSAGRTEGAIEIVVDDDGPGITPELREDAFRPFRRLDPSRDPNKAGVGLGLTIARDIARGHGGDILLGDGPRGGLRATIRLPA